MIAPNPFYSNNINLSKKIESGISVINEPLEQNKRMKEIAKSAKSAKSAKATKKASGLTRLMRSNP